METMQMFYSVLSSAVSGLVLMRHGDYVTTPLLARVLGNKNELFAQVYSRRMPDVMFPLNEKGVKTSLKQGEMLASAGVKLIEVFGSESTRGAHTGLCVAEGYIFSGGGDVPFFTNPGLNYPIYDYHFVRSLLETVGDPFVAQWLNGLHEGLVPGETPITFQERIMDCVSSLLSRPGVRVACSHFEIITLVHGLMVEGRSLGNLDDKWAPTKNGGVLLWKDESGKIEARDFMPDFQLL